MDPTYSRDECIAAIKDFYAFLGKMYLDLSSFVIYPPADGWPNMTPEVMGCLGKDREIISLLRHLPYPEDRPFSDHPDCSVPAYRLYDWKTSVDKLMNRETKAKEVLWDVEGRPRQFGKRIPKNFVGLVNAFHGENVVLLDVKEGLVYWMDCPKSVLEASEPQPSRLVYPLESEVEVRDGSKAEEGNSDSEIEQGDQETPPTSDDEGGEEEDDESEDDNDDEDDDEDSEDEYTGIEWGPCWPVHHFFAMLKNHYLKLNFIPYDFRTVIDIWTEETPSGRPIPKGIPQLLQSIYHRNGWPDLEKFNKEACLAELKKELAEKYPDINRYYRLER